MAVIDRVKLLSMFLERVNRVDNKQENNNIDFDRIIDDEDNYKRIIRFRLDDVIYVIDNV